MIGKFWAPGITVRADERADGRVRWAARVRFEDHGFVDSEDPDAGQIAVVGSLSTRYFIDSTEVTDGLTVAIDTVKRDAEQLGIEFVVLPIVGGPLLCVNGDGEYPEEWLPANWRDRLAEQARRIGWKTYGDPIEGDPS